MNLGPLKVVICIMSDIESPCEFQDPTTLPFLPRETVGKIFATNLKLMVACAGVDKRAAAVSREYTEYLRDYVSTFKYNFGMSTMPRTILYVYTADTCTLYALLEMIYCGRIKYLVLRHLCDSNGETYEASGDAMVQTFDDEVARDLISDVVGFELQRSAKQWFNSGYSELKRDLECYDANPPYGAMDFLMPSGLPEPIRELYLQS